MPRQFPQLAHRAHSPARYRRSGLYNQRIILFRHARSAKLQLEEFNRSATKLIHRYASFPGYDVLTNLRRRLRNSAQPKRGSRQSLHHTTCTATVQSPPLSSVACLMSAHRSPLSSSGVRKREFEGICTWTSRYSHGYLNKSASKTFAFCSLAIRRGKLTARLPETGFS